MDRKSSSPVGCHVMAKPSGSKCNLDCTYCFYLEKHKLYPDCSDWRMNDETLEKYIEQHILAQDGPEVTFAWQGGEPTLMGLPFFRKAVALQQKYAADKKVSNTFQTNGLLLDHDWCRFFKQHNFLIGISLDGPREVHDAYRVNRSGKGTFERVIQAVELLKQHRVAFNTLSVISNISLAKGAEVYRFLKSIGSTHMQFIPLVERRLKVPDEHGLILVTQPDSDVPEVAEWSVTAEGYGEFLRDIFDIWIREDVGNIWVQDFENLVAVGFGYKAQSCITAKTCGSAFALESNGDVYACDHYVNPEYKWGNIHQNTLRSIVSGKENQLFANNKTPPDSSVCHQCDFLKFCYGGCPKHRFIGVEGSNVKHNYLCKGYKLFYAYATPFLDVMLRLNNAGYHPCEVMKVVEYNDMQPN